MDTGVAKERNVKKPMKSIKNTPAQGVHDVEAQRAPRQERTTQIVRHMMIRSSQIDQLRT